MNGRFPSLEHAPAETRRSLRDRLQRFLGHEPQIAVIGNDGPELRDEDMLRLLQSLDLQFGSEIGAATAAYDGAAEGGECSFDKRLASGWARAIWGRVRIPREVNFAMIRSRREVGAFQAVLARQHQETIRLARPEELSAELLEIGRSVEQGTLDHRLLNCLSPSWVAARAVSHGVV